MRVRWWIAIKILKLTQHGGDQSDAGVLHQAHEGDDARQQQQQQEVKGELFHHNKDHSNYWLRLLLEMNELQRLTTSVSHVFGLWQHANHFKVHVVLGVRRMTT